MVLARININHKTIVHKSGMSIACLAICIHTTRTLYNTRLTIINYPDGL